MQARQTLLLEEVEGELDYMPNDILLHLVVLIPIYFLPTESIYFLNSSDVVVRIAPEYLPI